MKLRLAAWTPPIAEAATFYPSWGLGMLDEAGIELDWRVGHGSPGALAMLDRGEADVAFVSCLGFLQAVARGERVVAVYNVFPRSCFAVFGAADRGIRQSADLVGRRCGVRAVESSGTSWLRLLLRLAGMHGDEIEVVVAGDDGVAMLLDGRIDSLVGSDAVLYDARRAGLADPFVFWLDEVAPLPSDLFAVRTDRLIELTPMLTRYLAAYERGVDLATADPERAERAIAALAVDGHDRERNLAMIDLRLKLSTPRPHERRGCFNPAMLQSTADLLAGHGLLAKAIDVRTAFVCLEEASAARPGARWAG